MRTLLVALTLLAASVAVAPPAHAEVCVKGTDVCVQMECLQVYPWSRLCEGDVVGFLEAYLGELCERSCLA